MTDYVQRDYFNKNAAEWLRAKATSRTYVIKARALDRFLGLCSARCVVEFLCDKPLGQTWLEVGAGNGGLAGLLSQRDRVFIATDIAEEMMKRSGEAWGVHRFVADVYELRKFMSQALGHDGVHCVYGNDVLHHLDRPVDALKACRDVMFAGGRIAFIEPNPYHVINLKHCGEEHEQRLWMGTRARLEGWMKAAGFYGVTSEYLPIYLPANLPAAVSVVERAAHVLLPERIKKYTAGTIMVRGIR